MKLKLDENIPEVTASALTEAGHKASTVKGQGMCGVKDVFLAKHCQEEQVCLVTMDLDFSNPFVYPPEEYSGIIVLRHPRPTTDSIRNLLQRAAAALERESVTGSLWIVGPWRLRIFGGETKER